MDDGERMAQVVWFQTGEDYADHLATHGPYEMEPSRVGPSVLDSPVLPWVTVRPKTLERRTLPLPQRIARQVTLVAITLTFTGVVAYAGYIEGL
jgi:hypothetical protein